MPSKKIWQRIRVWNPTRPSVWWGIPGIEPGTSRTLSENHAARPNPQLVPCWKSSNRVFISIRAPDHKMQTNIHLFARYLWKICSKMQKQLKLQSVTEVWYCDLYVWAWFCRSLALQQARLKLPLNSAFRELGCIPISQLLLCAWLLAWILYHSDSLLLFVGSNYFSILFQYCSVNTGEERKEDSQHSDKGIFLGYNSSSSQDIVFCALVVCAYCLFIPCWVGLVIEWIFVRLISNRLAPHNSTQYHSFC